MPTDKKSRLPVLLKDVEVTYKKPERRNDLVNTDKYDAVDDVAITHTKLGTNGVAYVSEEAFPKLFQLSKSKAAYVYENQIPADAKIDFDSYAHSSAVVGLLDKKAQETPNADTQALLQYSRDLLVNISDSSQAQDLRRKRDTHISRELPKLRQIRQNGFNVNCDELTGEPLRSGAAFHHVNPKEIHTDPKDVLNPEKGRILNKESHTEVHKENINDEAQFEAYKKSKNK
jgi:hypothetical protein